MNVNDTYVLMQYILNKNQQGYLSPADFNNIINQAQRSYISYLIGSLQKYQYGRPVAPVELGGSLTLRQILSPFIVETNLTVNTQGFCPYPSDYVLADAMWTLDSFNRIREVEQDKLYSFYNSQIDPVADNPIYLLKTDGLQIYPIDIGNIKLSYVRNAPNIIWSYTLDANGRPVYSEAGPQLATTASGTGWTGTGFSTGYTHTTPAGTAALTSPLAATQEAFYNIVVTISGPPGGYVTINFGGITANVGTTGSTTISGYATTNGTLSITPFFNFNGTVSLTINQASVQPLWGDTTMLDVLSRALLMAGVNLQSGVIMQYANEIKNTGQ